MKKIIISIALILIASLVIAETLDKSTIWYAPILRSMFPLRSFFFHSEVYRFDKIDCLPVDITRFTISEAKKVDVGFGPAYMVKGSVTIGKLPDGYRVMFDGDRYMLFFQAYLRNQDGTRLLWEQKGNPHDSSWISKDGGTVSFTLINRFENPLLAAMPQGQLIVFVAGDPIGGPPFYDDRIDETRVILGAKTVN